MKEEWEGQSNQLYGQLGQFQMAAQSLQSQLQ